VEEEEAYLNVNQVTKFLEVRVELVNGVEVRRNIRNEQGGVIFEVERLVVAV
jgi:hypothetical protein